ncbi:polysaccharide chain length determinant protein (PEP-CTERM system associated) [Silvibacterium bohemicum]|uniref:Polysaccharide chain length determinant protein (PEP-CTERM system associated) n=1 Tax=Silvibacterium bohemicum TaxID=1577686 RepID=A0A841JNF3_9BACT|nr:XrtA system polysaccharide chain length determinant [Silvibacterium bohemicum]MBB6142886.1 polysaccharide chain length determinant protein (PEP-CTERM system associated) [Silvibacterium bohemicum]
MPEDLEEQGSKPFDIQRYLDVVRRRHPYFLVALLVGWSLVWGVSWILPSSYKSSTLILVEQPTMPKDYVISNINDDLQDRLQNISQQILSRTRLLNIIDRLNLYSGGRTPLTPDEKVGRMRKDIEIELVRDPQNTITAFNIYYSARDPNIAQQVTGELTNLFISENLAVRQQQSEDTTRFLAEQLESARQSLAEQDAKIREFKGGHVGDLPTQQASNLQILAGLQSQLQSEDNALTTAQQQRVYLQTLINQYRTLQGSSRTADGAPTGLPAIDHELEKLKAQLADLSSHYTDQYPDIRNLKVQIAKTEKMRDDLIAGLKNRQSASLPDSDADAREAEDSLQNPAMLQLRGQLQANQAEISNHERAVVALKGKIGDYQARLNEEPVSEQQLSDLTRGYDQSKANYDDLLRKENESKMATSMEQMQKGERFRMLDPPSLPLKPSFPNRLKFCGIGLGVGLALGVVIAGGLEFMDDRIHSEEEIKDLLPMKVISEIPEIVDSSDERKSKKRILLGWAMSAVVVAIILAGSALSYRYS